MTDVAAALRMVVADHLRKRGLAVDDVGDELAIRIGDATLTFVAAVYERHVKKDSAIIGIECRLKLWRAECGEVIQRHTGLAEQEHDALAQAVHDWLDGVWPVLEALYRPDARRDLAAPIKLTTISGTDHPVVWEVLLGPPLAKCEPGMLAAVDAELRRTPPFTLTLQAFADTVHQRRIRPDGASCWGHLYAGRLQGQPGFYEATLRTDPWPEAVAGLLGFPWPASEAFMSFRQFFVIRALEGGREPGTGTLGGADAPAGSRWFFRRPGRFFHRRLL